MPMKLESIDDDNDDDDRSRGGIKSRRERERRTGEGGGKLEENEKSPVGSIDEFSAAARIRAVLFIRPATKMRNLSI